MPTPEQPATPPGLMGDLSAARNRLSVALVRLEKLTVHLLGPRVSPSQANTVSNAGGQGVVTVPPTLSAADHVVSIHSLLSSMQDELDYLENKL